MKETDIQAAICDYLAMRRVFHWRNNTGAMRAPSGGFYRFGTPGSPDIIAVRDGRAICLEVKTGTGKLSEDQEEFRSRALKAGAQHEVVRSGLLTTYKR